MQISDPYKNAENQSNIGGHIDLVIDPSLKWISLYKIKIFYMNSTAYNYLSLNKLYFLFCQKMLSFYSTGL